MSWKDKFPKDNRYFETENGILYCGDCLEIMRGFPKKSVDLVLTDPPYGINKKKIQNDENLDVYVKAVNESFRILRGNAFLVLFSSVEKIGEVIALCESIGLKYKWQSIFYIKNGMVRGGLGFSVYYPTLFFMKGNTKIKKQLRDVIEGVFKFKEKRLHPYQKDLSYIEKLIKTTSERGSVILDPFLGSGTTAVAAEKLNRRWIGIELNPKYCEIAKERIKNEVNQLKLF